MRAKNLPCALKFINRLCGLDNERKMYLSDWILILILMFESFIPYINFLVYFAEPCKPLISFILFYLLKFSKLASL